MFDAAFLQDPYPIYRALRSAGALHWNDQFFGGAWLLLNYADVAYVLRDARFSARRAGGWANRSGPGAEQELREFKRIFARSLLFLNPPQHTRLRQAMNPGFRPAMLQAMAPRIQTTVDQLLAGVEDADEFDFMRDFAAPLPALVIADMLGIDANARADFVGWSDDIAEFIGSPTPTLEIARRAQAGLVAMNEFFAHLVPDGRRHPGDGLVSVLIRAEEAGQVITTKELLAQCASLLFAGHETTRNLLGNGLLALLRHPAQWQRLAREPALLPGALKELLRYDSPVQYTGRRLLADVQMHGRRLARGQLVITLLGAANRDPAEFTEPDRLDITRNQGNHLSFGFGAHVCIGATLTYLEAEIAFQAILRRFPGIRLADHTPRWSSNSVYRGVVSLPVHGSEDRGLRTED